MAPKRPHTEKTLSETRSRESRYDELQKKTAKDPHQMNLGFDAKPPSRSDAKHLVDERRRQQSQVAKPKAKTVRKPQPKNQAQTKPPPRKEGPHHAQPVHSSEKSKKSGKTTAKKKSSTSTKKPVKKGIGTKKPVRKSKSKTAKRGKNRKGTFNIQISLPVFIAMVVVIALLSGSLIAWKIVDFRRSGTMVSAPLSTRPATVVVEAGMSARMVSKLLEEHGVVADAKVFERYMEARGGSTRIQAGTFVFDPGLSHPLIAEMLMGPNSQREVAQEVMVYPGFTIKDIDDRLSAKGMIESGTFLEAVAYVAQERGLPFAEGWFLSGSYVLDLDGSVSLSLARSMQDACNDACRPYLEELEQLSVSLSDAVVIASLVQRETNDGGQMPAIAGVIYNRLQSDMSIGIDAALRYRFDAWNRELEEDELNSIDPYNVRRIKGLPPTGIGAPSPAAIQAAMQPDSHSWLYYIHDQEGNLHFAETYAGHQDNIEKFIK